MSLVKSSLVNSVSRSLQTEVCGKSLAGRSGPWAEAHADDHGIQPLFHSHCVDVALHLGSDNQGSQVFQWSDLRAFLRS